MDTYCRTGSKFISASDFANQVSNPVYLYKNIWREHTTLLLHAPREIDKTEKALDIAAELTAGGRDVIYVNTSDSLSKAAHRLKSIDRMLIFTPQYESPEDTTDYADLVIAGIEEAVAQTDVRTFIIDSVTRIAALSFGRNASAAYVMKRLVALQVRCRISLLVISHDSTRSVDRSLLNLADSEIALAADAVSTAPVMADESVPSDDSVSSDPSVAHSRRNLSRRDRRILRRQAQASRK